MCCESAATKWNSSKLLHSFHNWSENWQWCVYMMTLFYYLGQVGLTSCCPTCLLLPLSRLSQMSHMCSCESHDKLMSWWDLLWWHSHSAGIQKRAQDLAGSPEGCHHTPAQSNGVNSPLASAVYIFFHFACVFFLAGNSHNYLFS